MLRAPPLSSSPSGLRLALNVPPLKKPLHPQTRIGLPKSARSLAQAGRPNGFGFRSLFLLSSKTRINWNYIGMPTMRAWYGQRTARLYMALPEAESGLSGFFRRASETAKNTWFTSKWLATACSETRQTAIPTSLPQKASILDWTRRTSLQ